MHVRTRRKGEGEREEREREGEKRRRNRTFEKEEKTWGKRKKERMRRGRMVMCGTENLCASKQAYTRENKVNSQKFMTKSVFRKNCNWQA